MTVSCLFAKSLVHTRVAACAPTAATSRRLAVAVASRQVRRRGFHTSLAATQAATLVVPETDKHHRVFSTAHVQEQEVQVAQTIVSKEDERREETKRRRLSEVRRKKYCR